VGLLTGCHVLVVDDHEDSRLMLRTVLETEHALVTEAEDAERAVRLAGLVACDLVITDIAMGPVGRDGVWLLDRVRATAELTEIPVIAITGFKDREPELRRRGFARVLIKPVDVMDLSPIILTVLNRR